MNLVKQLLAIVPDRKVLDIRIGIHWTGVVVDAPEGKRCGLASTLVGEHQHGRGPDVPDAGSLLDLSARELAAYAESDQPTLSSLGVAALNALLPAPAEDALVDLNAEDVITRYGAGKSVALIGSFPFIPRIQDKVGKLTVLEKKPEGEELPAESAEAVLPNADVVAITGMTLVNHTFESLFQLCSPESIVLMLGPSTPLNPIGFEYGIDLLSGSVVTDVDAVLRTIEQGANFRQVHRAGVRLVTMTSPRLR